MKCLACKPPEGNHMPFEAFREAQNTHYFVSPNSKGVCYIVPYVVVFDGMDVLVRHASQEQTHVDIGWKFPIYKNRKLPEFADLIEQGIKDRFIKMWHGIRTMSKKPKDILYDHKNKIVKKPGSKYIDLPEDQISVHTTNRGCYSLHKRRFHPVYFIILPNTRPVNLIPEDVDPDNKPAFPIEMTDLAADFNSVPLTYTGRKVMEMVTSGEIVLPVISGDPEWPEV